MPGAVAARRSFQSSAAGTDWEAFRRRFAPRPATPPSFPTETHERCSRHPLSRGRATRRGTQPAHFAESDHGERAMLAHVYLKKGAVVPMHSHDNEQITYVLEGRAEVQDRRRRTARTWSSGRARCCTFRATCPTRPRHSRTPSTWTCSRRRAAGLAGRHGFVPARAPAPAGRNSGLGGQARREPVDLEGRGVRPLGGRSGPCAEPGGAVRGVGLRRRALLRDGEGAGGLSAGRAPEAADVVEPDVPDAAGPHDRRAGRRRERDDPQERPEVVLHPADGVARLRGVEHAPRPQPDRDLYPGVAVGARIWARRGWPRGSTCACRRGTGRRRTPSRAGRSRRATTWCRR